MFIIQTIKNIFSKLSKIFIVAVVFFVVINLFFAFTSKDKIKINPEETTKNQRAEIYKILNDPQYQKTPEGKTSLALYRGMLCTFIGEACTDNPADADKNYNKSIMGFMGNLIAMPYANPPASGVYYAYDTLQNAGFVPKAYAAEGIGFASLKPLMSIWKAFRNVAYLILVIVLIAIGFMIMFRMKLNPQTVISMENTLPKIIVSMILITFSFAIAGFLIDLMYFGIALIVSLLSTVNIGKLSIKELPSVQNKFIDASIWNIWPYDDGKSFLSPLADLFIPWRTGTSVVGIGNAFVSIFPRWIYLLTYPMGVALSYFIFKMVTLPMGKFFHALTETLDTPQGFLGINVGNMKGIPSWIFLGIELLALAPLIANAPGVLFGIFFMLTLIFLLFRIFFMLLKSYISSIILIVFAPIFLLFNSVPGKNVFSFWLKSLLGELLTFPLVILLILLGYLIANLHTLPGGFYKPPFLVGIDPSAFSSILGMGIVLVIPQLVKTAKELIGIKGMPDFKPGFMAGGATLVGGGLGLLSQFGSLSLAVPGLRRIVAKGPLAKWFSQEYKEAAKPPEDTSLGGGGGI